jgi:dTMP kinase
MFICFEGIDGAGKSTQARMLQQRLAAEGHKVELVADPGTTKIGTAIRQLLLDNDGPITPVAQMLLFSAGRAELSAYAAKQIKKQTIIICDRWFLSTLVYQGVINNMPQNVLLDIFGLSNCIVPNICFLLDLAPAKAKQRMGKPRDRYERKCMADRKIMRDAYLKFAGLGFADVTEVISADKSVAATHRQIYAIVKAALPKRKVKPPRKEPKDARLSRARTRRTTSRA